jgi:hypothetical protein
MSSSSDEIVTQIIMCRVSKRKPEIPLRARNVATGTEETVPIGERTGRI